jgi:hypothetical protein
LEVNNILINPPSAQNIGKHMGILACFARHLEGPSLCKWLGRCLLGFEEKKPEHRLPVLVDSKSTNLCWLYIYMIYTTYFFWLVVSTPLKNISQMGLLFPIYGK